MKKFALIFLLCLSMSVSVRAEAVNDPKVEALGAVIIDFETARVLWGKNQHAPMAMASTTKIMTALLALEKGNLQDIVTVSKRAASAPEVNMNLKTGEKIELNLLMHALMLQSSNDAAVAIAEHVGGSVEEFCRQMTERAKEIGALDTVFETPNGLDAGQHHSTAYDMALITREALKNPLFVKIINTPEAKGSSDRTAYYISNKNRLLNEYQGANGVKTGFTGKAGHCFVGAAKRGDMQLISVVLASGWGDRGKAQKWVDTKRLLDYGFSNFKYKDLISSGDIVKDVNVLRSKTTSVPIHYESGLKLPITEAEQNSIRIEIEAPESIMPPVKSGEKLGVARVYLGQNKVGDINLITDVSAERHDLKTSLEKVLTEWVSMSRINEIKVVLPEF